MDRGDEAREAFNAVQQGAPAAATALLKMGAGLDLDAGDVNEIEAARLAFGGRPSVLNVARSVEPLLLKLGVNPAGPKDSLQAEKDVSWVSVFDWNTEPVRDRGGALTAEASSCATAWRRNFLVRLFAHCSRVGTGTQSRSAPPTRCR